MQGVCSTLHKPMVMQFSDLRLSVFSLPRQGGKGSKAEGGEEKIENCMALP